MLLSEEWAAYHRKGSWSVEELGLLPLCCSSASHYGMIAEELSCVMPSDPGLGLTPQKMLSMKRET